MQVELVDEPAATVYAMKVVIGDAIGANRNLCLSSFVRSCLCTRSAHENDPNGKRSNLLSHVGGMKSQMRPEADKISKLDGHLQDNTMKRT